jgi:hypothetical protein
LKFSNVSFCCNSRILILVMKCFEFLTDESMFPARETGNLSGCFASHWHREFLELPC